MSMVSSPSAIQLALSEEPSESPPSRRHRRRVKASWWDYPRSVNWSGIQILPQPSFVRKIRRFEIHCPPPWQLPVPPPLASPCSHPRPMLGNSAQFFFCAAHEKLLKSLFSAFGFERHLHSQTFPLQIQVQFYHGINLSLTTSPPPPRPNKPSSIKAQIDMTVSFCSSRVAFVKLWIHGPSFSTIAKEEHQQNIPLLKTR